ncbi:MAG: hypothetical protein IPF41_15850 [Flavobacteriales bacterium]|nr:hypothetical protein [Flavobacteriales bacterium]
MRQWNEGDRDGCRDITLGDADVVVVSGMESMSQTPYYVERRVTAIASAMGCSSMALRTGLPMYTTRPPWA